MGFKNLSQGDKIRVSSLIMTVMIIPVTAVALVTGVNRSAPAEAVTTNVTFGQSFEGEVDVTEPGLYRFTLHISPLSPENLESGIVCTQDLKIGVGSEIYATAMPGDRNSALRYARTLTVGKHPFQAFVMCRGRKGDEPVGNEATKIDFSVHGPGNAQVRIISNREPF